MSNPPSINSKTSLLLLLDYQIVHSSMIPNASDLLNRVANVISFARSKGIKVAHVRMAFTKEESSSLPATNKMLSTVAANPTYVASYLVDAPTAVFESLVTPDEEKGDLVLRKTRVGPFLHSPGTPDLDTRLREMGIDTLILGGVATGGAVLATVVQAADLDYRMFVVEDLCMDRDQGLHEMLVEKIFTKRGWVVQSKDLKSLVNV